MGTIGPMQGLILTFPSCSLGTLTISCIVTLRHTYTSVHPFFPTTPFQKRRSVQLRARVSAARPRCSEMTHKTAIHTDYRPGCHVCDETRIFNFEVPWYEGRDSRRSTSPIVDWYLSSMKGSITKKAKKCIPFFRFVLHKPINYSIESAGNTKYNDIHFCA